MTTKYKKSLGQHFIYDEEILKKIVKLAEPINNHHILEIGGGAATLTRCILNLNPLSLTTIELDIELAIHHEKLKKQHSNYNFILCDALKFKINQIKQPCAIIANLPYNISSVLLLKFLEEINHIDFLILMFQKEVAQRITAQPNTKSYGKLSVLTQLLCKVENCFSLPPTAFIPAPKVDSSVVKLTPCKEQKFRFCQKKLKTILHLGFGKRRKIVKKSLAPLFSSQKEMLCAFDKLQISQNSRIEEIEPTKLAALSLE